MPKAKHKPPSRERYETNNPTVSFRASRGLHEKLNEIREKTGKSYADIIKESLGVQKTQAKNAYKKGYDAGYDIGFEHGIQMSQQFCLGNCSVCGEYLEWDLDNEKDVALLRKTINDAEIFHTRCK